MSINKNANEQFTLYSNWTLRNKLLKLIYNYGCTNVLNIIIHLCYFCNRQLLSNSYYNINHACYCVYSLKYCKNHIQKTQRKCALVMSIDKCKYIVNIITTLKFNSIPDTLCFLYVYLIIQFVVSKFKGPY